MFAAEAQVEVGDPIEYFITLPTPPEADWVRIRCLGKVVRVDANEVAATLERYEFVRTSKTAASEKPEEGGAGRRKADAS